MQIGDVMRMDVKVVLPLVAAITQVADVETNQELTKN